MASTAGRWPKSPTMRDLTGGLVPVVVLDADHAHARISTVRHNRARGSHYVNLMAAMVTDLYDLGLTEAQIMDELGMEAEEVHRLAQTRRHSPNASAVSRWAKHGAPAPKHKAVYKQ